MTSSQHAQAFLAQNANKFPTENIQEVKDTLEQIPEDKFYIIHSLSYKEPTTMLLLAIFTGSYGVDRFLLNDTTNGVLKLILTNFCCVGFVWVIIDCFSAQKRTREFNLKLFRDTLQTMNLGSY